MALIVTPHGRFELRSFLDHAGMLEDLKRCEGPTSVICPDYANRFWSLIEIAPNSSRPLRGIGVGRYSGLDPLFAWDEDGGGWIVGTDDELLLLDPETLDEKRRVDLWCCLHDVIFLPSQNRLVVITEIAALGLGPKWDVLWEVSTDIITDYEVADDVLRLKDWDHIRYEIDIDAGRILKKYDDL